MRCARHVLVLSAAAILVGCGGGEEYKYAIENPDPPETVYANEVYSRLQEMKQQNAAEGPQGVDTVAYLEGMEGYGEEPPVGDHAALYEEIHAGVRGLASSIDSGASKQEVASTINELLAKAEALPHTTGQPAPAAADSPE